MYPFVAGLFLVFLLAFYVLIGVARPNTFADHEAAFSLLFVVGAMAPSLLHLLQMRLLRIAERANQPHPNQITTPRATSWRSKISQNFTRLWKTFSVVHLPKIAAKIISSNLITWVFAMLVVVSLALTWIIFRDLWPMIRELLQEGGYLHFGLIAFAGFLAWRLDRTTTRRVAESPGTIAPATLITGTIIAALSILSVIFFAGRVYCFIPVYKGGGDFTTETTAVLLFDPKFTNSLPPELKIVGGRSTNLYIVYQNNSSFFLAVPTASNNPTTWRHVGHTNKPSKIYSIRKESVISYEFGQSH